MMLRFSWRATATIAAIALLGLGGAPASAQSGAASPEPVKVIVLYESKPGKAERARLRQQNQASIRYTYDNVNAIAATIPPGQIKALRSRKNVKRVELDHQLMLLDHAAATGDPELENSWGTEHIGAGRVHLAGRRGAGIRAAVIDTGIDCSHPELAGHCTWGVSYVSATPDDDHGHGTHVSGILAAADDGSGVVGVAPEAELVAMKVLDSSGSGDYSGLIAALDQIATWNSDADPANDIDVANMSIGGHEVSTALQAAVGVAHASGVVLVAASGNVNPFDFWELFFGCPVVYPAAYPQVMATTFTNGNDALTGYSCTGPEVDLAAPGDGVLSSVPTSGPLSSPSGYVAASGTSMASPHVAGTVALLLEAGITDANGNGALDELEAHICANTKTGFGVLSTPIPTSDPRYPQYFGCGVVDAGAAVLDDPPGGGPPPPPPPPPPPANVPPDVEAGDPRSGDEGSPIGLAGGSAVDSDGTVTSTLWSVSDPATCAVSDAADLAAATVTCSDDGTFDLTLTATDDDGDSSVDTATLIVANVAPIVEAGSDQSVDVGVEVSLDPATFSDAGSADTHTAVIDWGDGSVVDPAALDEVAGTVSGAHTYTSDGIYTVTVTVTDDDHDVPGGVDGRTSDTLSVSVDAPPPPPPPPPANETITFTPAADTWVNRNRANRNYGSAMRLQVLSDRGRTFLRFDVSGVTGSVIDARLRLYVVDAGDDVTAQVADVAWAEDAVTWNAQPARGAVLATVPAGTAVAWVEFDVTAAIGADGAYGFALLGNTADTVKFHSREAAQDPELVIEFQPGVGATTVRDEPGDDAEARPKRKPKPKRETDPVQEPDAAAEPTSEPVLDPLSETSPEPTPLEGPERAPAPESSREPETSAEPESSREPETSAEPESSVKPELGRASEPSPEPEPRRASGPSPQLELEPEPAQGPETTMEPAHGEAPSASSGAGPANVAPTADAGGPYRVDEGGSIELDGRGSFDRDGSIVAYAWSPKNRLDDPTKTRPVFTPLDDGVIGIELTVTDDQGATDTAAVKVKVRNVDPVVADIEPRTVPAGSELRIDVTFEDPGSKDRHALEVAWGEGTTSSVTVPAGGDVRSVGTVHTYAEPGDYRARITVRDDDGGIGSTTFRVLVEARPDPSLPED